MNLEKILISLFIKVKVGENMKKLRKIKVSNDKKNEIYQKFWRKNYKIDVKWLKFLKNSWKFV